MNYSRYWKILGFTILVTLQALLLSERKIAEEAKAASAVTEAKYTELTKNLEESHKKVDQLQESVQRFVDTVDNTAPALLCILYSSF